MAFIGGSIRFAFAALALTGASAAWAEDTCHGFSIGNAKDRVLVHLMVPVSMHLATGECGASSTDAQGNSSSECTYTDADGDQWTSRNEWVSPGKEGTWCNVTGTGKYQGRMGGCGWWKSMRRGALNSWEFGGQCLLPAK